MVGGKNDEGIVETTAFLQGREDAADFVVYLQDEGRIVGAHLALLFLGVGALGLWSPYRHPRPTRGMKARADVAVNGVAGRGIGNFINIDLGQKLRRGVVGVVRAGKAHHAGEGPIVVVLADEASRRLADEVIPIAVPRQKRHASPALLVVAYVLLAHVLAVAALLQVVPVVVLDVDPHFVFAGDAMLEAKRGVPRIEVHLADGRGEVAVVGQHLRPSADAARRVIRAQVIAVGQHVGAPGVEAGKQRTTRRHTDRVQAIRAVVADPLGGNAVDVGRGNVRRAVTTEKVVAHLVGHDEQ